MATEYSPTVTILSGEAEAVGAARATLARCGLRVFPVRCGFAPHSPLCDSWERGFRRAFHGFRSHPPVIPIYSALAGGRLAGASFDSRHWWGLLRATARTAQAARSVIADGYDVFLEIGPQPTLSRALKEAADLLGKEVTLLATMLRGRKTSEVTGEPLAIRPALGV